MEVFRFSKMPIQNRENMVKNTKHDMVMNNKNKFTCNLWFSECHQRILQIVPENQREC